MKRKTHPHFQDSDYMAMLGSLGAATSNSKIHICPHCQKIGRSNIMYRYHFDRCHSHN